MQRQLSRSPSPTSIAFSNISNYRLDSYGAIENSKGSPSSPVISYRAVSKAQFEEFAKYLPIYLTAAAPKSRTNARPKLTRLTIEQFHELSTDVYDELIRRNSKQDVPFLHARKDFHPKRNLARQKLATLPTTRFEDLSSDVYFELARRYPEFEEEVHPPMIFVPVFRSSSAGLEKAEDKDDLGPGTHNGDRLYERSVADFIPLGGGYTADSHMANSNAGLTEVMEKMRLDYAFKIALMQIQITELQRDLRDANDKKKECEAKVKQLEAKLMPRTNVQDIQRSLQEIDEQSSQPNNQLMIAKGSDDNSNYNLGYQLREGGRGYKQELTNATGISLSWRAREFQKGEKHLPMARDGGVQDIHITTLLSSIDNLLIAGRSHAPIRLLRSLKAVVEAVTNVTEDVKTYERRPQRELDLDIIRSLKQRAEATLSILITVTTTHASSSGVSPQLFSLLDAAASHVFAVVAEIGRTIFIRKTTKAEQEKTSYSGGIQLEEADDDSISTSYRSSEYSLASSRTDTTDYGHYARRMALSQEVSWRESLYDW